MTARPSGRALRSCRRSDVARRHRVTHRHRGSCWSEEDADVRYVRCRVGDRRRSQTPFLLPETKRPARVDRGQRRGRLDDNETTTIAREWMSPQRSSCREFERRAPGRHVGRLFCLAPYGTSHSRHSSCSAPPSRPQYVVRRGKPSMPSTTPTASVRRKMRFRLKSVVCRINFKFREVRLEGAVSPTS